MRRLLPLAVFVAAVTLPAAAEDLAARGQVAYQQYKFGDQLTSGMRQTFDLRWQGAFTMTSLVRLYLRGDDFKGTVGNTFVEEKSRTRQLQPGGEFVWNTDVLRAQLRSELLKLSTMRGPIDSSSTLRRSNGIVEWSPDGLPVFGVRGQRDQTNSANAEIGLTVETAAAGARYEWRGLQVRAEERFARTTDVTAGYDRKSTAHAGNLSYSTTTASGKLSVAGSGDVLLTTLKESATGARAASVAVPVSISRALYAVDDTPADSRDHPFAPYPLLIDGNLDLSAGISLGPDAISFQNLGLDLGRTDRLDEIRVVARDPAGNPLRTGGGGVTWDLYTSEDGQLWAPLAAQTAWVPALSYYSVTFAVTTARWFKVVNFGVNVEATVLTEIQAYYHRQLAAGVARSGTQNQYNASATVTAQPTPKLTVTYTAGYNAMHENVTNLANGNLKSLQHEGEVQYRIFRNLALREVLLRRTATSFGIDDSSNASSTFLDWTPTRQLRTSVEIGHEMQTVNGSPYNIDTRAVHGTAMIIRSVSINFSGGVQTQKTDADHSTAERHFFDANATLQLVRSLRLELMAISQRTTSTSLSAFQVLGPERDTRYAAELTWRPGRPLVLRARVGHVSGVALSGYTQQYHAEWYPFADGTVSLGGTYDQDVDAFLGRRASRFVFNPKWLMNRHVAFDVNYTAVSNGYSAVNDRQRTVFATVTLTK